MRLSFSITVALLFGSYVVAIPVGGNGNSGEPSGSGSGGHPSQSPPPPPRHNPFFPPDTGFDDAFGQQQVPANPGPYYRHGSTPSHHSLSPVPNPPTPHGHFSPAPDFGHDPSLSPPPPQQQHQYPAPVGHGRGQAMYPPLGAPGPSAPIPAGRGGGYAPYPVPAGRGRGHQHPHGYAPYPPPAPLPMGAGRGGGPGPLFPPQFEGAPAQGGPGLRPPRITHAHNDPTQPADRYRCEGRDGCWYSVDHLPTFNRHQRSSVHNPNAAQFACTRPDCDKSYTRRPGLRNHYQQTGHGNPEDV